MYFHIISERLYKKLITLVQETDNIGCLLGRDLDGQKQSRKKHFFFTLYFSKFQLCEYISYSLKNLKLKMSDDTNKI